MKKVNILHIQVLPIMSGVQKAMLDILERLDREKYNITILCTAEGELTEAAAQLNINFITLSALRRKINPLFDILAFIKLFMLIKQYRFLLVHTHSSKSGFIGRLAARAAGVKCIVHTVQGFAFHEYSSKMTIFVVGLMERIAALVSDKIIFVNQYDKMMATKMRLATDEKSVIIPNGIDFADSNVATRTNDAKESIGLPADGAVVAMVARLWEQKAPQDFIRAVPIVVKEIPTAKFLVIGDGHLRKQIEQLTRDLRVSDNVQFLGWRNDVRELLKAIDVFVLPSLWEGLPVSILEAMATAKPVVASNIKGNNELVVDGKTGYLVEPKKPAQIGEKVLNLLKNRTLAVKMGLNGYKRVKENYHIKNTVGKINQLYDTLLIDKA